MKTLKDFEKFRLEREIENIKSRVSFWTEEERVAKETQSVGGVRVKLNRHFFSYVHRLKVNRKRAEDDLKYLEKKLSDIQ